jgi:hypothetical protein
MLVSSTIFVNILQHVASFFRNVGTTFFFIFNLLQVAHGRAGAAVRDPRAPCAAGVRGQRVRRLTAGRQGRTGV